LLVVVTLEAHLPNISDILLFAVLRANGAMYMMADFMEQDVG
jgi:hypothetical protein